jgi:hypothetical protein
MLHAGLQRMLGLSGFVASPMRGRTQRVRDDDGYAVTGLRRMQAPPKEIPMKLRRLMFPTASGLAMGVFAIDPPLLPGEVEICMDDPPPHPPSRAMNAQDLTDFFESRSAMGKIPT